MLCWGDSEAEWVLQIRRKLVAGAFVISESGILQRCRSVMTRRDSTQLPFPLRPLLQVQHTSAPSG